MTSQKCVLSSFMLWSFDTSNMNVDMVDMLINRLGEVEDTVKRIETAIQKSKPAAISLQHLTPEMLRQDIMKELLLRASNNWTDWATRSDLDPCTVDVLKSNGFRVLRNRVNSPFLWMVDWDRGPPPTVLMSGWEVV